MGPRRHRGNAVIHLIHIISFIYSFSEPIKDIIKQLEQHHEKEKQGFVFILLS